MAELEQERSSSASSSLPRWIRAVLLTAAAFISVGCSGSPTTVATSGASDASVVAIIDGDTLDLDIGGVTERVRLIGIDTPESVSTTTPKQCFGAEATEALRGLLPIDSRVTIERDAEARDRYGRLLLYVHRSSDGLFVNEWMVQSGFANAIAYAPNDSLASGFTRAESLARQTGSGLWAACDGPDQPLD